MLLQCLKLSIHKTSTSISETLGDIYRLAKTESKPLFTLLHEEQKSDSSTEALGLGLKFNPSEKREKVNKKGEL